MLVFSKRKPEIKSLSKIYLIWHFLVGNVIKPSVMLTFSTVVGTGVTEMRICNVSYKKFNIKKINCSSRYEKA